MPLHTSVWTNFLAELGVAVEPGEFHQLTAGKTNPEILRRFLGTGLSAEQAARHSLEKERRYRRLAGETLQPLPGLADFLRRARSAGLRVALATSAGQENIRFMLGRLALAGCFDALVGEEDVTRSKPDPQAFLLAAARLGLEPARCLAFEDSPKGIAAAQRAGMPVVAVLTALSAEQALALPGVVAAVRDYTQIDGFPAGPAGD
jgi:HAD superfamily hydrolase (TIGR01509 family)